MADITMCHGRVTHIDFCPLKANCFRFLAKREDPQAVFINSPYSEETKSCSRYWKIKIEDLDDMNRVWR